MAMSDCELCWDTPCTCGYGYINMSEQQRLQIETAIRKARAFRVAYHGDPTDRRPTKEAFQAFQLPP